MVVSTSSTMSSCPTMRFATPARRSRILPATSSVLATATPSASMGTSLPYPAFAILAVPGVHGGGRGALHAAPAGDSYPNGRTVARGPPRHAAPVRSVVRARTAPGLHDESD